MPDLLGLRLSVRTCPPRFLKPPPSTEGRSGRGYQAPRASPWLQPSHQSLPRAVGASGGCPCWGQVCSRQRSSILLIKPDELQLTKQPCHVASSQGCPSVGLGGPLSVQLNPAPPPPHIIIESGESPGPRGQAQHTGQQISVLSLCQLLATLQALNDTCRWWLTEGEKLLGRSGHGAVGRGQPKAP